MRQTVKINDPWYFVKIAAMVLATLACFFVAAHHAYGQTPTPSASPSPASSWVGVGSISGVNGSDKKQQFWGCEKLSPESLGKLTCYPYVEGKGLDTSIEYDGFADSASEQPPTHYLWLAWKDKFTQFLGQDKTIIGLIATPYIDPIGVPGPTPTSLTECTLSDTSQAQQNALLHTTPGVISQTSGAKGACEAQSWRAGQCFLNVECTQADCCFCADIAGSYLTTSGQSQYCRNLHQGVYCNRDGRCGAVYEQL